MAAVLSRAHFLTYLFHGIAPVADVQVSSPDPAEAHRSLPAGSYGFSFYEVLNLEIENDDEEDEKYRVVITDPLTYIVGYLYTPEQIQDLVANSDYILEQMLEGGIDQLILTTTSSWEVWQPTVQVVLAPLDTFADELSFDVGSFLDPDPG